MSFLLVAPIRTNKSAFLSVNPAKSYLGDWGDADHQKGAGDHTAHSSDVVFGRPMRPGYVYAQDFGAAPGFDLAAFTRHVLNGVRAGRYPEVKYVISRIAGNKGRDGGIFYGLFDRRYNWKTQRAIGHTTEVHISYMPGFEYRPSTIVADFYAQLHNHTPGETDVTPDELWDHPVTSPSLDRGAPHRAGEIVPVAIQTGRDVHDLTKALARVESKLDQLLATKGEEL